MGVKANAPANMKAIRQLIHAFYTDNGNSEKFFGEKIDIDHQNIQLAGLAINRL
jgi:hypothetical protein